MGFVIPPGAAFALVLVGIPVAAAHDVSACCDEHRYVAGELLASCSWDEEHGGALPFHGMGGGCFDFGTDMAGGNQVRIEVIDDLWGRQVGGVIRIVSSSNAVLQSNTPFCGEYPEGGGFSSLPAGAFRLWVFVQTAGSVVNCLAYGESGGPATTGVIRVCTA